MKLTMIKKLCKPAYIYLVLSAITMIVLILQNGGNTDSFCMGNYECYVPNTSLVFLCQFVYIAFWTFVLDSICKSGHKDVSWFLVIFPYLLFFVLLGFMMTTNGVI